MFVKFKFVEKIPKEVKEEEGTRANAFGYGCLEGDTSLKRLIGIGNTGRSTAVISIQVCNRN